MKSANQKRQHVLIIPGGLLATSADAASGCSATSYEVEAHPGFRGAGSGVRRPVRRL